MLFPGHSGLRAEHLSCGKCGRAKKLSDFVYNTFSLSN